MKILILGGTGAMGTHLVEVLSKIGHDCYVTSRQRIENSPNTIYIEGNAHQASCLMPLLCSKWDAIVDFMIYTTSEFCSLAPFFLKATNQYFFLSSCRVFADTGKKKLTEESPRLLDVCKDVNYLITDEYALAKARQENILYSSELTNYTIIRPYVTYAEYRLQLSCMEKEEWLWRAMNHRSIILARPLAEKMTTFTYGRDVARSIASLIGKKQALGESFNVTGNDYHTWGEILEIYLSLLSEKMQLRPRVYLPENYLPFQGGGSSQVKYDRMYNRQFDNSKLSHFIDTKTFMTVRDGLSVSLDTFLRNPHFQNINWDKELQKDILARDFVIKDIPGRRRKISQVLRFLHIK